MIKVRNLGSIGKTSQQRKTIEAALSNVNEEEVRKAASEQRAKMEAEKKQKADAKKEKRRREKKSLEAHGETQKKASEMNASKLKKKGPCVMWMKDQ